MNLEATRVEARTILSIGMPLMAAYIAEIGMMLTDMIIVGRLGASELAAVGLAADWLYVLLLIGMGVLSIVGVMVAQHLGARNLRAAGEATEQGMAVALLCSVPVMIAIWFLGPALSFTGQDERVIALITDYARMASLCVPPVLWFVVLRNYVSALARAGSIMLITVGALVLNLVINYALVFGRFGMPAMGVVGAALGTVIVNWVMFLLLAYYVRRSQAFEATRPRLLPRRIDFAVCREMLALGLPVSGAQLLGGGMFTAAAVIAGTFGAEELAAQMIVFTVIYFGLSAAIGFGDAARVRVAYGIGRRSVAAARRAAGIAATLAGVVVLVATLFLWLFPAAAVGIFLNAKQAEDSGVLTIALTLAFYGGLFQLVDGVMIVFANALRGLRDTQGPLWITGFGYWVVGLGSGGYLSVIAGFGVVGLWWGLIAGATSACLLMLLRLRARFADLADDDAAPALGT